MKKTILLLVLFSCASFAQVEYSEHDKITGLEPSFYIDCANYKSDTAGKTRLDVFIQIPYSSIQFVRKGTVFNGSYMVTLTFYNEDESKVLLERFWQEKLTALDFSQAVSKKNYNFSHKSFDFEPGKYSLKCIIEDEDSKKSIEKRIPVKVKVISDSLGLSDIIFVSEIVKDGNSEKIVPNVADLITSRETDLSFSYDIYSSQKQNVFTKYILSDPQNDTAFGQIDTQAVKAGTNHVYFTIKDNTFNLGKYNLKIVLKDNDVSDIDSVEKSLYSRIYGMPASIVDLNKAIEEMVYIAPPVKISEMQSAETYQEKLEKFIAFWDSKKPNKNSDENPVLYEYYRRIDYANKHFKAMGEGWRSDMGMIYVTFGPPNNVERRSIEMDSKPYEIWQYYELDRYFVFVDNTGFGDYYLANPDYSRWPGYR